jgi:hypothetical protein
VSQPSQVVADIVTSLGTFLGADVAEVKAIDGDFGEDGPKFTTTKPTAVLVTCLGFRTVDYNWDPPTATAAFGVFCLAKLKDGDLSAADVASDQAGLVAAHVSRTTFASTQKRATNIRATNLRKIGERTKANVWAVEWLQEMPLTPALDPGTLNKLRTIATTYAMGDAATPDIQHTQTFPAPEEP